jgi:hypothetical protein
LGTESINSSNVPQSQVALQLEPNASKGNQAESLATVASLQADLAKPTQTDAKGRVSQLNEASKNIKPDGMQSEVLVALNPSLALKSVASSVAANVSSVTLDPTQAAAANEASPQSKHLPASTVANLIDSNIVRANSNLANETTTVSPESKAETEATHAQENAFNFDAKLAKSDTQQNPKALENAGRLVGAATRSPDSQISTNDTAVSNAPELDPNYRPLSTSAQNLDASNSKNIQTGIRSERAGEALPVAGSSPTTNSASTNRLDSATLTAASPNSAVIAQEAPRAETTQSLEDISSSFVSSLVGGPQRPVTTVMDWISMQSQERPAPLVPHEVRLDAGAVQLEIQKMVKQGGGHVVMELTPPDQSKFTIELKLDERGNALLIVEGVSDSTKTRLEQSAPQLREQFQQMGLELQLDMRQQGQSASYNAEDFAGSQERDSGDNNLASNGAGDTPKVLTQREAGANRARESGSNQVYLYA